MSNRRVLIGCVFLAGCVVGGVSAQLAPPVARAGTSTGRWEHYCFVGKNDQSAIEGLNQSGRQGWELVTAVPVSGGDYNATSLFCMKRGAP